MAIVTEKIDDKFVKTYSDAGYYIHGGQPEADYTEAVDPISSGRTYTETNVKIPTEDPTEEDYALAGKILLGEVEA